MAIHITGGQLLNVRTSVLTVELSRALAPFL